MEDFIVKSLHPFLPGLVCMVVYFNISDVSSFISL